MAKKQSAEATESAGRISRKEYLLERRRREERRRALLIVAGVGGLLALVLLIGVIVEGVVVPGQAVATVNGENITLREWQERVEYQRASLIILLEDQLAAFTDQTAPDRAQAESQAIGFVQQFLGQQINALAGDPELLGEFVLDRMIEDVLIRQEAERLGIVVTEADVDAAIAENFQYYGGQSPTPFPTPTPTIMPTPSITPLPTATISTSVPVEDPTPLPTATTGPTSTPPPTATPVSLESFETARDEELARFREMGIDRETYRSVIRAELYRERVQEVLAEELPEEAEHYSFFYITTQARDEAEVVRATIADDGFLAVWNQLRSLGTLDGQEVPTASATEIVWRTAAELEPRLGNRIVEELPDLPLNETSGIVADRDEEGLEEESDETPLFYIFYVTGRELRVLSEAVQRNNAATNLSEWLNDQRLIGEVRRTELWRTRVPRRPLLDPKFLQPQPTPTSLPAQLSTPVPLPTLDDGS